MSNVSLPANGFARSDVNISLSGYTPIGVVGWSGVASQGDEYFGRISITGSTLTFIVFNRASSIKIDSFGIDILYKKQF